MNPFVELAIEAHPLLDLSAFVTRFPDPLGRTATPQAWEALRRLAADAPLHSDDDVRGAVRNLLRHGGYKPTGRGKPASEFLLRSGEEGLRSINAAVDACNICSLHSGLPISVVDLGKASAPFRVAVASTEASYLFNPAGQTIELGGLLCLHDADGPCANAVKDAQRTKTDDATRSTLSLIWGTTALEGRAASTATWYRELLESCGAQTEALPVRRMTG